MFIHKAGLEQLWQFVFNLAISIRKVINMLFKEADYFFFLVII